MLTINQQNQFYPSSPRVEDLVTSFLAGRKRTTLEAYHADLTSFAVFLGHSDLRILSGSFLQLGVGEANHAVLMFRNYLQELGRAPSSINRKLATIRSFTKMARLFGLINWSVEIQNLRSAAYRDTSGPPLVAFKRMIEAANRCKTAKALRDKALLRILFDLALRANEAVSLDVADYNANDSVIWIIGKGESSKIKLTLPETSKDAIEEWLEYRGRESGPLFVNFDRLNGKKVKRLSRFGLYQVVRALGESVDIKTRPHGLRHLSITEACKVAQNNGYGIEDVMSHSRHRSVATLMIYRDKENDTQEKISSLVSNTIA